MASTTIVHLFDDIDGSEAERSVDSVLDGVSYSVDLSAAHIAELQKIFDPYGASARRVGRGQVGQVILSPTPRGTAATASRADKDRNARIRAWAASSGQQVAERGRISHSVEDAYDRAMAQPPAEAAAPSPDTPAEPKATHARKAPSATFSSTEQ